MYFNSTVYGLFLIAVFAVSWLLVARRRPARFLVLLVASWFFYACWTEDGEWVGLKYLVLILGSSGLDWFVGNALHRLDRDDPETLGRRRRLLFCSLAGNLGVLGLFKYYDFFANNVSQLTGLDVPLLKWALPVGISFYTFQTLSYTIDIYRGKLAPAKNLGEFALFVAFFPQLVAGPIVRASDFLPQLENRPRLDREALHSGLFRIMEGLFKKVVIADVIGVGLVDGVFANGSQTAGLGVLLGIWGYALQIYGDFAGYSDIAIGSARLLGFRIPENFHAPYKSTSIQDFWRRWHISLSSWLRDYLYIPLGGNRKGPARTYINLAIVMLLGGLWHGAAWTFVVWGAIHGGILGVNRWWQRRGFGTLPGKLGQVVAIVLTFHLVCLAWVFFRSRTFGEAGDVLDRLCTSGDQGWFAVPDLGYKVWFAFVCGYLLHFLPVPVKARVQALYAGLPSLVLGALWAVFFGFLAYMAVDASPFIYFQF